MECPVILKNARGIFNIKHKKMNLKKELENYVPFDEREAADKKIMLEALEKYPDIFTRENSLAHFTASSWVTNPDRTKILMAYHRIFDEWAWSGGHADGENNLLAVAERELCEETGVKAPRLLSDGIYAVEIIPVDAHVRRGELVSPHLHLDVCYLFEADETEELRAKEDENTGVKWIPVEEAVSQTKEAKIETIYSKLNEKLKSF